MKKRKLNYVIYNPNTIEETADFLLKLLVEANSEKVERAIEKATLESAESSEYIMASEDEAEQVEMCRC